MKFRLLTLVLAATLLSVATPALAARATDVLDANDGDQIPLDFEIDVEFRQEMEWAMISRERNAADGNQVLTLNQDEFVYEELKQTLDITGRIGIWRDVEFHFTFPVTLNETSKGKPSGHWRNKYWSAIYPWQSLAAGGTLSQQPTSYFNGGPSLLADRVFGYINWESVRSGFGDMTLGFAWAPLNNERDDTFPSWKLAFDLGLPTGSEQNPRMETSAANSLKGTNPSSNVGRKVLTFNLSTAISKRFGFSDPYFGGNIKIPVGVGTHLKDPRIIGGFMVGNEFILFERFYKREKEPLWKIAFDFRASATIYGRGQDFTGVTDPLAWRRDKENTDNETYWPDDLRRVTSSTGVERPVDYFAYDGAPEYEVPIEDRYTYIEALVGLHFVLYHYVLIGTQYTFGHRTDHFLSLPSKVNDLDLRNLNSSGYNAQINETGARIRKEGSFVFSLSWSLGITF